MIALFAFCGLAYGPLGRAGFIGADLPVLAHASRIAWTEPGVAPSDPRFDWNAVLHGEARPLAAASLALSSRLWSDAGTWPASAAAWLRAENLLCLLLAGWMIGRTVQRALVPWWGSEVARSASWASAMILATHPFAVPAVASPAARGDLLAIALGALAAAVFMRARQERSTPRLFFALLCAALCGLASDLALLLPVILAVLEYSSARRHRSIAARLRTALTTAVGFAVLVSLDLWIGASLGVARPAELLAQGAGSPGIPALDCAVEKLGVLLLPVPPGIHPAVGYTVAGLLALLALQPALVAARSAPKLWGWILLAWTAALALALLPNARTCVRAADFTNVHVLLPGAVVMAAGFAVTSTAVSGIRRTALPLVMCAGYAALAHSAASSWPIASAELARFTHDVARARQAYGADARVFVLSPPGSVAGLAVLGDSLPLVAGASANPGVGLDRATLYALSREPEFEMLCRDGLVVLLEPASGGSAGRPAIRLEPAEPSEGPLLWRDAGSSPVLGLDPRAHRAVRVTALPGASTTEPPLMRWRSRSQEFENGSIEGVWIAGRDGSVAVFDLSRSLEWLAGKRIARIWFERSLSKIVSAEILADVAPLAHIAPPDVRSDDWGFDSPPEAQLPRALHGEARWVVGVLDLGRYRYAEFVATQVAPELLFKGASEWERSSDGPIVWSLEYRVGGAAIARASGRRTSQ